MGVGSSAASSEDDETSVVDESDTPPVVEVSTAVVPSISPLSEVARGRGFVVTGDQQRREHEPSQRHARA
jgi:hypothetical protein